MKPFYKYEKAEYQLRPARKPQIGFNLAGVVILQEDGEIGYVYVKFDRSLEIAVGKAMPQGVGPYHRAYLRIIKTIQGEYAVYAQYLGENKRVLLWINKERPSWLKRVLKVIDFTGVENDEN